MDSEFLVGEKVFQVKFSKLGFERYYYDGKLLMRRWSFKFIDTVSFNVDGHAVDIKVNLYPKTFSTQAFVDGALIVEELLPDMKEQVEKGQQQLKKNKSKNIQLAFIWVTFMALFLVYFQWKG
ncbi:hypothetical protein [Alteromonas oceanisediminis]|uniref:hypothetical protein n=1 Tax=Alteromonas oceanisediminis TaxID=2836180 RepID=UPI001BD9A83D|nr:hypothetical protein [Alteromonas oceanisediminis]MBT0588190.1 hypothetical protein [Alteromonas oceanisediminis]